MVSIKAYLLVVCGVEVGDTAKFRSVYKGKTYYFCAPGCKVTFDENPEKCTKA